MNEYDGSFGNERPMDLDWLIETAKHFAKEYRETRLTGIGPSGAEIQINYRGMKEIAPISQWQWVEREGSEENPHGAHFCLDGVRFYTILTDEEREEVLRGER